MALKQVCACVVINLKTDTAYRMKLYAIIAYKRRFWKRIAYSDAGYIQIYDDFGKDTMLSIINYT